MTISCERPIDDAFTIINLKRLVITGTAENQRSRAIPQRLGFIPEGIARDPEWLDDRFVGHDIDKLLDRDWNRSRRNLYS
jgi:ribosomal-protein-serine acetyltransferase